jgi:hypothetical protein
MTDLTMVSLTQGKHPNIPIIAIDRSPKLPPSMLPK